MTPNLGSRSERFKQGKELRHKTPREAHADLKGSMTRSAIEILAESDAERFPELVPERYRRMMLNPFAFCAERLPSWRQIWPASRWPDFRCRPAGTAI